MEKSIFKEIAHFLILGIFCALFGIGLRLALLSRPFYCNGINVVTKLNYKCENLYKPFYEGEYNAFVEFTVMKNNKCPQGAYQIEFYGTKTQGMCDCRGIFSYNGNQNIITNGHCGIRDSIGQCHNKEEPIGNKILLYPSKNKFCAKYVNFGKARDIAISSIGDLDSCPKGKKKCPNPLGYYSCIDDSYKTCPLTQIKIIKDSSDPSEYDASDLQMKSFKFNDTHNLLINPSGYYEDSSTNNSNLNTEENNLSQDPVIKLDLYFVDAFSTPDYYYYYHSFEISYNFLAVGECVNYAERFFSDFKGESLNIDKTYDLVNKAAIVQTIATIFVALIYCITIYIVCEDKFYSNCIIIFTLLAIIVSFVVNAFIMILRRMMGGTIDFEQYCPMFTDYNTKGFDVMKFFCTLSFILLIILFGIFSYDMYLYRDQIRLLDPLRKCFGCCGNCCQKGKKKGCYCCCCYCEFGKKNDEEIKSLNSELNNKEIFDS